VLLDASGNPVFWNFVNSAVTLGGNKVIAPAGTLELASTFFNLFFAGSATQMDAYADWTDSSVVPADARLPAGSVPAEVQAATMLANGQLYARSQAIQQREQGARQPTLHDALTGSP
jgi:hypothetical protein